jgi:hypothetical protein
VQRVGGERLTARLARHAAQDADAVQVNGNGEAVAPERN